MFKVGLKYGVSSISGYLSRHATCAAVAALGVTVAAAVVVLCQDNVHLMLQPLDGGAVLGGNSIDLLIALKITKKCQTGFVKQ